MYQQQVTDLKHLMELNTPGICGVLVVEKAGVQSMPTVLDLMQRYVNPDGVDFYAEEIILKDGYSWKNVSTDFNIGIELDEEEKVTAQGNHFLYKTIFKIANDHYETRGKIIRAYDGVELIALVKESTGNWRLMGSLERGCTFTAQLSTGTVSKGPNKFECGLTWECGGDRSFYTQSFFTDADYFEISFDTDFVPHAKIKMQESVYVQWGDGTITLQQCITGNDNIITKDYTGDVLRTIRVYHHNKSTLLDMHGETGYNGSIKSISGILPKALGQFFINQNICNALPNLPASVLIMAADINWFDETAVTTVLYQLNANGLIGGALSIGSQAPPVSPSGAMIALKASLEGKGWTIVY